MSQFSSSAVSLSLQKLYEGFGDYGLISYPRTDSTRLSQTFLEKGKNLLLKILAKIILQKQLKVLLVTKMPTKRLDQQI